MLKQYLKTFPNLLLHGGLAQWIIEDGHLTIYNQTVFNTNSYTHSEIIILQEACSYA